MMILFQIILIWFISMAVYFDEPGYVCCGLFLSALNFVNCIALSTLTGHVAVKGNLLKEIHIKYYCFK